MKKTMLRIFLILLTVFTTSLYIDTNLYAQSAVTTPVGTKSSPIEISQVIHNLNAGETLVLGSGYYKISDQAYIRQPNITIQGAGIDKTIIDIAAEHKSWGITISGNLGNNGGQATLKDFTIRRQSNDAATIKVYNASNSTFKNIKTVGGFYGIDLNTATNTIIDSCQIQGATKAAIGIGGDLGGNSNISIENTTTYAAGWGIDVQINDKEDYGKSVVTIEPGNNFLNQRLFAESTIRGGFIVKPNALNGFVKYEANNQLLYQYIKATGVQISNNNLVLEVNQSKQVTATVQPSEYCDYVTWKSSDNTIASVNTDGRITGHKVGKATITVTANEQVATCEVEVTKGVEPEIPAIDPSKPVKEVQAGVNDSKSKEVIDQAGSKVIEEIVKGTIEEGTVSSGTLEKVKAALESGKTISVKVESNTIDKDKVLPEEIAEITDTTNIFAQDNNLEMTVAQYLNLGIVLQADNQRLGNLNVLQEPITFTIAIPETLKEVGRNYYVIRIHENEPTILETTLNEDGTLSFNTDCFSTYALVYGDKVAELPIIPSVEEPVPPKQEVISPVEKPVLSNKPSTSTNETVVKTSDIITPMYSWLITMLGSTIIMYVLKKEKYSK